MAHSQHPPVVLRIEPEAIPAVRAEIDNALEELSAQLIRLGQAGHITQAWLGDRISEEVRMYYQAHVMDSPTGPYAALVAYETELLNVRDTLQRMEQEYIRTDGEHAANLGRI